MEKIVYRFDRNGYYLYPEKAFEDPLSPGTFLVPADCTETKPPEVDGVNQIRKWNGEVWESVQIPESADPGIKDYVTWQDLEEACREGVNSVGQ